MSVRIMAAVWELDVSSTDKLVMLALADWSNDDGMCWPSMKQLADKSGLTDRAIRASVGRMVDAGHLSRKDNPGKGVFYTVHPGTTFRPEQASPRNEVPETPERRSANTSRTIIPSEAKASSGKRARDEFPCPDGVDQIDWDALKANRKAKRAALSEGAHRQISRKLEAWARDGWPPGPIVAHAAERGWTSVFETDEMKATQNGIRRQHNGTPVQTGPDGRAIGRTEAAMRNVLARKSASGHQPLRGVPGPSIGHGGGGATPPLPYPDSPFRNDPG